MALSEQVMKTMSQRFSFKGLFKLKQECIYEYVEPYGTPLEMLIIVECKSNWVRLSALLFSCNCFSF